MACKRCGSGLIYEDEYNEIHCICGFVEYRYGKKLLVPEEIMKLLPIDIRSQPKRNEVK